MSTSTSPVTNIPLPTLASALYHREQEGLRHRQQQQPQQKKSPNPSRGRNTRGKEVRTAGGRDRDGGREGSRWRFGIKELDREQGLREVFGGGVLVGDEDRSGRLDGRGRIVGFAGVDDLHTHSLSLVYNLIATFLVDTHISSLTPTPTSHAVASTSEQSDQPRTPPSPPGVFILEPPTIPSGESSLLHIYDILESRLAAENTTRPPIISTSKSKPDRDVSIDIDSLIGRIAVLPYLDLIGVSQALSEVSDLLHGRPRATPYPDPNPNLEIDYEPSSHDRKKTIVLLRNLPTALSLTVSENTSRVTQTSALLTEILRQLRRLSTSNVAGEVLILIETGSVAITRGGQDERRQVMGGGGGGSSDGTILKSAFSSGDGRYLRTRLDRMADVAIGGVAGAQRTGISGAAKNGLARILNDAVDGLVIVHDGFGVVREDQRGDEDDDGGERRELGAERCIVEVMKDRMSSAFGTWVIWDNADGK